MVITTYLVKSVLGTYCRQLRQRSMQSEHADTEGPDDLTAPEGKTVISDAVRRRMVMERMTSQALERVYSGKSVSGPGDYGEARVGCEIAGGTEDLLGVGLEDGLKGVRMAEKRELDHPERASKKHGDKANGRAYAAPNADGGGAFPIRERAGGEALANIEELTKKLMDTEEFRTSKVDYLRELIRHNAYVVHADKVAERMLEEIW